MAAKPAPFLRPNFGFPGKAMVVYVNPYTAEVLGSLAQEDRFREWSRKLHSSLLQGDGWRWMIELAASWLIAAGCLQLPAPVLQRLGSTDRVW